MDQRAHFMRSTVPGLLILLSLLLGGCAGGAINTSNSGVSVWLDQSPDGWTLPLAPFTLKAHASDSDGSGITSIAFLVSSGGGAAVNVGSVTTDASQDLVYAELIWNPAAEGEYLIQAQAFSDGGSQISQTARICISAGSGVSDALGNTCVGYNPPPDILALPTLTSTPTIVPRAYILTVLQNANCREGPGTVYPVVNSALAGQLVQVLGKNADQTWWYSQLANDKCWISNVAGTPSGDLSLLPIIDSPPTPVPTETEVVTDPDDDGDGYPFSNDCNDKDPTINPGAVEIKDDKIDSNCNGDDNT